MQGHCQPKVCGAAGTGLASADEEPIPIFRQLTRGDPARRLNVRSTPAVTQERRGPVVRAWHRHLP